MNMLLALMVLRLSQPFKLYLPGDLQAAWLVQLVEQLIQGRSTQSIVQEDTGNTPT